MQAKRVRNLSILLMGASLLAACSSLPASGPEERDILQAEITEANKLGFKIVDVTPASLEAQASYAVESIAFLNRSQKPKRADLIGIGDVISITIFEVGGGLFGSSQTQNNALSGGVNTSVTNQTLSNLVVDRQGNITLPYVGKLHVAGRQVDEVQAMVQLGLKNKTQDPQALVVVANNLSATVLVSGDVKQPGRKPLSLAEERLSDIIALSGGPAHLIEETFVDFERDDKRFRVPLRRVQNDLDEDVLLQPQDRISLVFQPRTYTVFGATAKVSEIPFNAPTVTLAEGIARSGGALNERADPNAVFLFRFESPAVADHLGVRNPNMQGTPVIYRIDLLNPTSYFLAQKFELRDKDLVYFANARTDRLGKFLGLIGGLFSPIFTGVQLSK